MIDNSPTLRMKQHHKYWSANIAAIVNWSSSFCTHTELSLMAGSRKDALTLWYHQDTSGADSLMLNYSLIYESLKASRRSSREVNTCSDLQLCYETNSFLCVKAQNTMLCHLLTTEITGTFLRWNVREEEEKCEWIQILPIYISYLPFLCSPDSASPFIFLGAMPPSRKTHWKPFPLLLTFLSNSD